MIRYYIIYTYIILYIYIYYKFVLVETNYPCTLIILWFCTECNRIFIEDDWFFPVKAVPHKMTLLGEASVLQFYPTQQISKKIHIGQNIIEEILLIFGTDYN